MDILSEGSYMVQLQSTNISFLFAYNVLQNKKTNLAMFSSCYDKD